MKTIYGPNIVLFKLETTFDQYSHWKLFNTAVNLKNIYIINCNIILQYVSTFQANLKDYSTSAIYYALKIHDEEKLIKYSSFVYFSIHVRVNKV